MMRLLWTPEAVRDREDIYDYIEEDNPLAALALDALIAERTAVLQDFPRMGRGGRVPDTFELAVHSSYMVVYDIVETQVRILNVVHTARQCRRSKNEPPKTEIMNIGYCPNTQCSCGVRGLFRSDYLLWSLRVRLKGGLSDLTLALSSVHSFKQTPGQSGFGAAVCAVTLKGDRK